MAVANGGGIRGDKIYSKGEITSATLQEMHPFGNTIVIVKLTGAQLKQVLERGAAALAGTTDNRAKDNRPPSGAFLRLRAKNDDRFEEQAPGIGFRIKTNQNRCPGGNGDGY